MGTRIKDAALVGSVSEGYKIPVSDGSNQPKTASVGQLSEFVNQKYGVEQKLSELGSEVGAIRKQFETFVPNSNIAPALIWEKGYIASDGTIAGGQNHTYIDIPEGAEFLLTNARSVGIVRCVWLNGNTIISTFNNDSNNYKKILIPSGANRVGISNFSSNPLDSVFVIFNPTEIDDVIKSVESATYQYRLEDAIIPTYTSASGNRTYTYYSNGHTAAFFTGCVFTSNNNKIPEGIFTFYDINGENLGEIVYYNIFKGYIQLPLGCSYFSLTCFYTSNIGYCFLAESKTNSLIGSIADNSNNINMLTNKFEPFFTGKQILDDGAYINFSDKEVGKNMTNEQYDLGHEGVVFAEGMSNLIVQPEGYIGGDNLQNSFYLTLKMKKNCTYIASTIIGTSSTDLSHDGVLIISDEQSRDGGTSQFHQRIVHVLLPNLNVNGVFSIQLGDKDAEKEGKKRWNYEYSEPTIEEVYSNIKPRQVDGIKLLWEIFIEGEMMYIYLDHELVKIYRNVSDKNENVSNFSFSSLIPNAKIGEVENCKVVDFAIGRRRQTYNSFVSLYNAKKYLL